jgi:glyoxylase-like metal-dependent hydrolase (beta-lactamase superfamily II)
MEIITYQLGSLQANCYLLVEDKDCLIIDPADDAPFLLEEIQRRRLNLIGMLATHGHFDHIGAVGEIQLSFNIPLCIFKEDQFLVDRVEKTAKHFLDFKPVILPIKNIKNLKNENSMKIENFKLKIIHTPGHTPGGCCFYFKDENALFTGDTLFAEGVGRTDLSYSSKDDLNRSLEKIHKLKDIVIYPGHGESAMI